MPSFPPVSPGLERVATLERQIDASLERVWENVRDWEHLPWLHRRDFASIELVEEGSWGWRARTESTAQPGQPSTVELKIDYPEGHYVTRTLDGPFAQTEIWTRLEAQGPDATSIRVEFWVPAAPGLNRERMGQGYLALYRRLWSEDETMMKQRTQALRLKPKEKGDADSSLQLELGPLSEVSSRLPFCVDFADHTWRICEVDGELVVHDAVCPHALGPLVDEPTEAVQPGQIECPWHGFRFDVRTGRSSDGRRLRLRTPPHLVEDRASGNLKLVVR
ncbi:Rieske 2Fe-2S domain-containing protein [Myxococcota bacterium]|nr:Rieske 2Fe-2S domain-containing protein [Myxococcota bacterium]